LFAGKFANMKCTIHGNHSKGGRQKLFNYQKPTKLVKLPIYVHKIILIIRQGFNGKHLDTSKSGLYLSNKSLVKLIR